MKGDLDGKLITFWFRLIVMNRTRTEYLKMKTHIQTLHQGLIQLDFCTCSQFWQNGVFFYFVLVPVWFCVSAPGWKAKERNRGFCYLAFWGLYRFNSIGGFFKKQKEIQCHRNIGHESNSEKLTAHTAPVWQRTNSSVSFFSPSMMKHMKDHLRFQLQDEHKKTKISAVFSPQKIPQTISQTPCWEEDLTTNGCTASHTDFFNVSLHANGDANWTRQKISFRR